MNDKQNLKEIWTVDQTQPAEGYDKQTIYIVSTREEAERRCRVLNKEYGTGCIFNEEGDFEEVIDGFEDDCHYYDIGSFYVDEPLAEEI